MDINEQVKAVFEQYAAQYPAIARLEAYRDRAREMAQAETDDTRRDNLKWLVTHAESAIDAAKLTDLDRFAQAAGF